MTPGRQLAVRQPRGALEGAEAIAAAGGSPPAPPRGEGRLRLRTNVC
jgi:hypothetical protein